MGGQVSTNETTNAVNPRQDDDEETNTNCIEHAKGTQDTTTNNSAPVAEAASIYTDPSFNLYDWLEYKYHNLANHSKPEVTAHLNDHQKELLQTSWALLSSGLGDTGVRMFRHLFQICPRAKTLFPYASVDDENLTESKLFRAHALRFMQALSAAVKHVDELESLVAVSFVNLGMRHKDFPGLDNTFFTMFTGAMLFVLREELQVYPSSEVHQAWCKFLDFLVQHVQYGYNIELK